VNINRLESKDPDGKFFIKEIIHTAVASGSGWVDYKYSNPKTGKVEAKASYVELVDGMVVGCGIYK
jgi:methyl-accepting chemotaxis protein